MEQKLVIVIGAIVAIIAVVGGVLYLSRSLIGLTPPAAVVVGGLHVAAGLNTSGYLFYDSGKKVVEYALTRYAFGNATNATFSLRMYETNPLPPIYLVNASTSCDNCFPVTAVAAGLTSALARYGLAGGGFSVVQLDNIGSTPPGVVIVLPTGLLPLQLVPNSSDAGTTVLDLLDRGDTVIYAGQNFSNAYSDGTEFSNTQESIATLFRAGLTTASIFTRNTSVTAPFTFNINQETFSFAQGRTFGPMTFVSVGTGTFIAFPSYPTSAWPNANAMTLDIATAINTHFWLTKLADGNAFVPVSGNATGQVDVFTTLQPLSVTAANVSTFPFSSYYSLLTVTAQNSIGGSGESNFVFRQGFAPNGTLSIQDIVPQTSGVPMFLSLYSGETIQSPHVDILNSNLDYVTSIPIGIFNSSLGVIKYNTFSMPGGDYIAVLRDFNNRFYGAALFHVANTSITPITLGFTNGTFEFYLTSDGVPLTNTSYDVALNGAYPQNGTVSGGYVVYDLPKGALVSYGNELFTFGLFGANVTYLVPYTQAPFHIPAIYIEFAVAAVIIILLNIILQPPNRDDYYIDVPTFPPTKRSQVKTSSDSVMTVFDKVNIKYSWRYMPLTVEEVRSGISSNIRVNNVPIAITLQNTVNVLSALILGGQVINMLDYYAPRKWIEESHHDVEYLVVFRKLRDYCVSHAIKFSELDTDPNCDMLLTKVGSGNQSTVFIYSASKGLKDMRVTAESRVFIIFVNEEARLSFMDRLYASYGEQAEILKTGIAYSYVRLVDCEHLDQLIL